MFYLFLIMTHFLLKDSVLREHHLTPALHAQTRMKYLTGCLYRVSFLP